jgi:hypothetical protein
MGKKRKSKTFKRSHKTFRTKGLEPEKIRPKTENVVKASSPSYLGTDELTTVYDLPTHEYKIKEQVLEYDGFKLIEPLDSGAFAAVFVAKYIKTDKKMPVK